MTQNVYEHEARERKARAIYVALTRYLPFVTADCLGAVDTAGRAAAANLAGVHYPSDETWAQVVRLVRERDAIRAALPADPFEGLTP